MDQMTEASHVTRSNSYWIPLATLAAAAVLAACGSASPAASSSSGSTPTASAPATAPPTAAPTVTTTTASSSCPSGSTVQAALGTSALPNAVGIAGGGSAHLPAGATGIVCEYSAAPENVIIEVIQNIPSSYISAYSSKFPTNFKTVSGLGDVARSFVDNLGTGKTNLGVVAAKGTTIVAVVATYTPATLTQVEALVSSLL
jgi:hypothetical protein